MEEIYSSEKDAMPMSVACRTSHVERIELEDGSIGVFDRKRMICLLGTA